MSHNSRVFTKFVFRCTDDPPPKIREAQDFSENKKSRPQIMPWELLSIPLESSGKAYFWQSYHFCIPFGTWPPRYLEIFYLCPGDWKV